MMEGGGGTPRNDYEEFQVFLKKFTASIDPGDQLPIRVSNYTITEAEFKPEVINFARQYLQDNDCPTVLLNAIVNDVLSEVKDPTKELHSGFEAVQNQYQPLKLMQAVISKVNTICTRLLDNAELMKLMPENCLPPIQDDGGGSVLPKFSAYGVKNSRRKMEDRHVVIQDFQELYSGKKSPRCCYYGLFDGHGGAEAAIYSVAHLAYHLRNSISYPDDPEKALTDAFITTDQAIISKYHTDTFRSGTTALVVLHFPEDKMVHVAWAGDSQALIVRNGETVQIVNSHKASRESERERIVSAGGEIFPLQGIDRVMGQLAITRAIGDTDLKPYITSEPELVSFELDGDEDFIIMASDGLWDGVTEDAAATEVYNQLKEDPASFETIPKKLVQLAKEGASSDNITIIIIYFKEPSEIAKFSWPSADNTQPLDNMETTTTTNATTDPIANNENPFGSYNFENSNQEHFNGLNGGSTTTTTTTMNNNKFIDEQQQNMEFDGNDNLLNFESQTETTTTNITAKGALSDLVNENKLDNEFGPETDVDAVDDAMLMSSPHSVSQEMDDPMLAKEFQQFEQKEIDFAEAPAAAPADPFMQSEQFIAHERSAAEHEYESFLKHTAGQMTEDRNVFGLPKEVLGVLESVPADGEDDEFDEHEVGAHGGADVVSDEDLIRGENNEESADSATAGDQGLLGDSGEEVGASAAAAVVAAANVDSEGESDDEWNYVKPAEKQQQPEEKGEENLLGLEAEAGVEQREQLETGPIEHIQEQHAEAQAIAESQEHCIELNLEPSAPEEDQSLLPQPDQQHVEQPLTPDSTSLLSVDTSEPEQVEKQPDDSQEEDMSSQLNPDALEFVPLSPQSSAPVSPALKEMDVNEDDQFGGGLQANPQIAAIMDSDRILAQSPRKNNGNTAQLDNVAIPDEREFDEEISHRPHEWSGDLMGKKVDLNGSATNGGGVEAETPDDEDAGALNSKEERDLDEEKEEIRDEMIKEIIANIPEDVNGHGAVAESELGMAAVPGEQDPMNMSFHQDVQMAPSANPFDLNAVQLLPTEDIEEEEDQQQQSKGDFNERPEVEQRMEQLSLNAENLLPESDLLVVVQQQQQQQQEETKSMELTESESNFYMQQAEEEPEKKEFDEKDEEEEEQRKAAETVKVETPPPTPSAVNDVQERDMLQAAISPEPQKLMEAVEKLAEEEEKPAVVAATVAAAAGVAALAVGAAAKSKSASPAATAAKKTTVTPAKKDATAKPKTPTSLGVKASPTPRSTPAKTGVTAAKVPSKASPTVAARTTRPPLTASKASPTAAARSPLTEKKPLSSATTPTMAAKRLTPSRPATASSLSGASPKPATPSRLTASARTTTTSTTSPKPAASSRLSVTKSSTATAPAAKKPATTTSTGLASRTLTSKTSTTASSLAAAKPKTATGVVSTTTTTVRKTTVSSSLSAKPKTTQTTTTTTSRLMNGTGGTKAPIASRVSATKTTPPTKAPTTTTRPASSTTAGAAGVKKGPTPGSASARANAVSAPSARPAAAKRTPITGTAGKVTSSTTKTNTVAAPKGSKPLPITKRNVVETKTTTTTTTVLVENGGEVKLNGDTLLMLDVAKEELPSEVILNGNGECHEAVMNGNGYGDGGEGQKMVIDLTAD